MNVSLANILANEPFRCDAGFKWLRQALLVVLAVGVCAVARVDAQTLPENIPDFSLDVSRTLIQSAGTGDWSSTSTWQGGQVPTANQRVRILQGHTVTIRDTSAVAYTIAIDGQLAFATNVNTSLKVTNLMVMAGSDGMGTPGVLEVGTPASPVAAGVTAEIVIANSPFGVGLADPDQFGTGILGFGKVSMHGSVKTPTFLRLATEPHAGNTTLTLSEPVSSGWAIGDRLVLPDTRHIKESEVTGGGWMNAVNQWEELTVQAISPDRLTLTLNSALQYDHLGARDLNNVLEFLPHVGNLTRNVVVRSESASGIRGHSLFTHLADVDIRYALFKDLGRTTYLPLNDVTNHIGRYPIHMHHLSGPLSPPANHHQFTLIGNAVDGGSTETQFKWGITVHGSHFGLIQDDVVYNYNGASFATEDGSETENVFDHNFAIRGIGEPTDPIQGEARMAMGTEGVGFWFRGPNNYVRNNVAANFQNPTTEAAYGFVFQFKGLGNLAIPNFPGAHMMGAAGAGDFTTTDGNSMPLRQFENNEAYGAMQGGFTFWWVNSIDPEPSGNTQESLVKDLKLWNIYNKGVYGYPSQKVTFDGMKIRGSYQEGVSRCCGNGVYFADYSTTGAIIRNADIQGVRTGITAPMSGFGAAPNLTIENSYLRNDFNVQVPTAGSVNNGGCWMDNKLVVVNNTRFAAPPGRNLHSIAMVRDVADVGAGECLSKPNELKVYAFNGNAADNFQVYHTDVVVLPRPPVECTPATRFGITGLTCPIPSLLTAGELAELTSPSPGSTLTSASQLFTWSTGTGVSSYQLTVGTSQGASDIYAGPEGVSFSTLVSGLPTNGGPIWVRLSSKLNGAWLYLDSSYTAAGIAPAVVLTERSVVTVDGATAVTTAPFNTQAGDLLVAFVASSISLPNSGQTVVVTGGGPGGSLTWTRVSHVNGQLGAAEIWTATTATAQSDITVTSTAAFSAAHQSLAVAVFGGAARTGATSSASGVGDGDPSPLTNASVSLTNVKAGSFVYGVGNDWDGPGTARTPGAGQTMFRDQYVNVADGDTFWFQKLASPVPTPGALAVQLNNTIPFNHQWNFAAVEIMAAAPTITSIGDQTTIEDTATGAIAFTVGDSETPAASLTVSGSSSNQTLVPNDAAHITFGGGGGASRTVTVTPAPNQFGTATITVTVSDGTASTSTLFVLTVTPVNDAATITTIADHTTNEDTATGVLAFTVDDVETPAGSLTVLGSSSNVALVPNDAAHITFGGGGSSRTVTVTPAANQSGTATITVTVSDGSLSTSTTFLLTVTAVNDAPSFTKGADQTVNEDVGAQTVAGWATAISAGSNESGQTLTFAVTGTTNAALFAAGPAVAANGTLSFTPAANANGSAVITLTLQDNGGTANGGVDTSAAQTFTITVTAVNDAPTITAIANQATPEDTATSALAFTVGDVETAAASLTVSGTSSNPTLVPNTASNITFGGSLASRTVTVTPAANQFGTTTITVRVTDGTTSTTTSFVLTVTAVSRLTWPTPADVVYGTALSPTQLNATANAPGTFVYTPAAGTVMPAGAAQVLTVTFTPTDLVNRAVATASVPLTVTRGAPVLTLTGGTFIFDGLPHPATATATGVGGSPVAGSFRFTYLPGGSAAPVNAGTYAVTAAFTSSDPNYLDRSVSSAIVAQAVEFASPAGGTAGLRVTHAFPAPLTGTVSVRFYDARQGQPGSSARLRLSDSSQAGVQAIVGALDSEATCYAAGLILPTGTLGPQATCGSAPQVTTTSLARTVGWHRLDITVSATSVLFGIDGIEVYRATGAYRFDTGELVVSAPEGNPGALAYFDELSVVPSSTPDVITIGLATPALTWNAPAAVVHGTPLSAAQLNATASVPGTFVYSPAAGTVLGAGLHTLSVTFTPTDAVNYTPVTSSVAMTVKATTLIADVDGDAKADVTVFRPANGTWYILKSSTGFTASDAHQWGLSGDIAAPGDYDGDGTTDLAVWRPSTGVWYILKSSTSFTTSLTFQWGLPGDVPVPGDYDGDGKMDPAVYRPSTGVWHILTSSSNYDTATPMTVALGLGTDVPVPADYDGDGKTDAAVYRPSTGMWYLRQSITGYTTSLAFQWGLAGDVPVPGYYDGDFKADLAVFRPATGMWYIRQSTTNFTTTVSFQWGLSGDIAVPSDYDGDGMTDLGVFRPATGTWYIRQSTTGYATSMTFQWGTSGDIPGPNAAITNAVTTAGARAATSTLATLARASDLDGDGRSDLTVYRPSTGAWFTLRSSTNYATPTFFTLGVSTDLPVTGDFDGDGKTDAGVYTPATGMWSILRSSLGAIQYQWGLNGDAPVPGDYDGDGRTDLAVYRRSNGVWYIRGSSTNFATSVAFQWGLSSDIPVPGDYDGDGVTDLAVYRPSTGEWFVRQSTTNYATSVTFQWGLSTDIPVPGDYDGDGKTDLAVYRPSTGVWYIRQSSTNYTTAVTFQLGLSSDVPVPGDFDGDGKTDVAVFRPSTGVWFLLRSSTGFTTSASYQWGATGDVPILKSGIGN